MLALSPSVCIGVILWIWWSPFIVINIKHCIITRL